MFDGSIDPTAVKSGFDLIKGALDALKSATDLFGAKSDTKKEFEEKIKLAERQVALGEAQLAQALGYKLCRAHFPPLAMLKASVHPKYVEEISICPECGAQEPSPEYFAQKEKFEADVARHNSRLGGPNSWMGS